VRVDGTDLERVAWSDQSPAPAAGRFAFDVVDPNPSPPVLLLRVDLPAAARSGPRVRLEIATQSLDASRQGLEHQSDWLTVFLIRTRERLEWRSALLGAQGLVTDVVLAEGDRLVLVARDLPKTLEGGYDSRDPAPSLVHERLIYRIGQGPWLQGSRSTSPGPATRGSSGAVELAFNAPAGTVAPRQLPVWMLVWRAVAVPADDADDDLLPDAAETTAGTDPLLADSDGDGIGDGLELRYGLDPLKSSSLLSFLISIGATAEDPNACPAGSPSSNVCTHVNFGGDADGDGVRDLRDEAPDNPDRDGDGLKDGFELRWAVWGSGGSSETPECREGLAHRYSSANNADSDWDGLSDGEEVLRWGSNPGVVDTDRDGILDSEEVAYGTDPRQANPPPPGIVRIPTGNPVPDC
jgi:hypothetical protein